MFGAEASEFVSNIILFFCPVAEYGACLYSKINHKTYQRDQGDRMSTIALTIVICIAIASLAYSVYEIISYKTDK